MVRKSMYMFLLSVLASALSGQILAAQIHWSEPVPLDAPLTGGKVLEAINLGGPSVADVGGVDFAAGDAGAPPPRYSNVFDNLTLSWEGPSGAGSLAPDPALGKIISTGRWIKGTDTKEIRLKNLTPGATYRIQLYTGDQRSCCSERGYRFQDGAGNISPIWKRGGLKSLVGEFTADKDTQDIFMTVEKDSTDPYLTGYVLSIVSSPKSGKIPRD